MERNKQTKLNVLFSLLLRLVTAITGLILPRLILLSFGSEANGLMQAINQILSYTVLFEMGIGGVIVASFYKPLAENDSESISDIFNYTKGYFKKISLLYAALGIVLALTAKFIISTEFDYLYVLLMVLILAFSTYFSYYLALPHQLLMKADQKIRIVNCVQIITTIINFVVCVLLINAGSNIHTVKLVSAIVFILNPAVYRIYVKKHYKISKNVHDKNRVYPQKRDGAVHHLSYFIHENTDIVLLSLICGVAVVSVYSVYNSVMIMLTGVFVSVSSGMSGAFGNMIALKEDEDLQKQFDRYECVNTAATFGFFTISLLMILPFVSIYTKGVEDIEYIRPLFAVLINLCSLMYCVRIPYAIVVGAAGHYKETKIGALAEVLINVVVSVVLVNFMGLEGVAIGTLLAMTYRTIYTAWYLSRNILKRPAKRFFISFLINAATGIGAAFIFRGCFTWNPTSIPEFLLEAVKVSVLVLPVYATVNILILAVRKRITK